MIFILAAGQSARFSGRTKQLLEVGAETILSRMIRQLDGRDYRIMTNNRDITTEFCGCIIPENCKFTCETFLSTRCMWEDHNTVLLGDVVYSDQAMQQILSHKANYDFFIKRDYFEDVVAVSFSYLVEPFLQQAIDYAHSVKGGGKLWHLYRFVNNIPVNTHSIVGQNTIEIKDFTTDIDTPEQWQSFIKKNRRRLR